MTTLEHIWPAFELRVRSGPLELRAIRDEDIPALVDLALDGIHDPAAMPFARPWTDAPADEMMSNMAAYYWRSRADFHQRAWTLDLTVFWDGEVVGTQAVVTHDYLVTRSGETGSWLGREHQGRGIGTRMRRAVCVLLFDHLDAIEVTSGAFTDNAASTKVSRRLGYVDNGMQRVERRPDELAVLQKLLLTRDAFVRGDDVVEVTGVDGLRAFVGLPIDAG